MSTFTQVPVGYQGFKSYAVKPISTLKTGQESMDRDYYAQVTLQSPNGKLAMKNFGRYQTMNDTLLVQGSPKDYQVPPKNANSMASYDFSHNPELWQHTRMGKVENMKKTMQQSYQSQSSLTTNSLRNAGASALGLTGQVNNQTDLQQEKEKSPSPTRHWISHYKEITEASQQNLAASQSLPSLKTMKNFRPLWAQDKKPHQSKRGTYQTEYMNSLGTYGTNPRLKLNQEHTKIEPETHELTIGTTKSTNHLPGYHGFIPKADMNPLALSQSSGLQERTSYHKQNIVENYQLRVPGYAGYLPTNVYNDRGTVRPNCLSTEGEAFH